MAVIQYKKRRFIFVTGGVIVVCVVYRGWFTHWTFGTAVFDAGIDWSSTKHVALDDPNQTCRLPKLNPFDAAILSHLHPPRPINCKWAQPRITLINQKGVLQFNQTALVEAGYDATSPSCYYQPILRSDGQDDVVQYGQKVPMTGSDVIEHDYVYVSCTNSWYVIFYTNIHIHPRELHLKRSPPSSGERKPSVLVFGIDSLSHMNAIRYLPKTYKYFTRDMGAHIMYGMVRIGENTWPNTIAMLTGKSIPKGEIITLPLGEYYDDYPLIWRNFSRVGQYVTLLAEDVPEFMMFNQAASGFWRQPTDHYIRPFWVALEPSLMHKLSSTMCFGAVPKHILQLNYLRDFAVKYRTVPYFAFTLFTELGHDFMQQIGAADEDFATFLKDLHEGGHLNNTILFFLGDHGHRIDPIRLTPQGRIESNMPLSAVVLPSAIKKSFPQIIQTLSINGKRLTSMFDYYDTFVDILRYSTGKAHLGAGEHKGHGYSLFQEIPFNRTCDDAGIPNSYCPCVISETELPINDRRAKIAANVVVSKLNGIIRNYTANCKTWTLSQIKHAVSSSSQTATLETSNTQYIRVTVEADPAKALFEGVVHLRANDDMPSGKISEAISRVNRYAGQESCVNSLRPVPHLDLRQYCYCL